MKDDRQKEAREAIAALPGAVRVGAYDFKIDVMSSLGSQERRAWGKCDKYHHHIRLAPDFPSAVTVVDALTHEILHAIWYTYAICDDDKEERIVHSTSTALVAMYRDNPWFLPWAQKWTAR